MSLSLAIAPSLRWQFMDYTSPFISANSLLTLMQSSLWCETFMQMVDWNLCLQLTLFKKAHKVLSKSNTRLHKIAKTREISWKLSVQGPCERPERPRPQCRHRANATQCQTQTEPPNRSLCVADEMFTEGAVHSAGFWIVGGKRKVSSIFYHCVTWRWLRAPTSCQKMANLPADQLSTDPSFRNIVLEIFWPLERFFLLQHNRRPLTDQTVGCDFYMYEHKSPSYWSHRIPWHIQLHERFKVGCCEMASQKQPFRQRY